MIKFEVCRCTKKFNDFFEIGDLYVVHASKSSGEMTAYASPTQGFLVTPDDFVTTRGPFYKIYFETIAETRLKNYKEVKAMKKKPIEEILTYFKVNE